MKQIKRLPVALIFIAVYGCGTKMKKAPITDFSELIQPASKTSVLAEDGYYVWGGSVIKGNDEFYHMYYSRWKHETYFNGWVTHSEIAHAIAERPEGPFRFKDVALLPRGAEFWDGLCTHNPTVKEFDGKYYLYYMGNTGNGKAMENLNFTHRNKQRIGVAWANNPNGPWYRNDKPFINVSPDGNAWDALMISNPSVTKMRNGKYLVVYKAVAKHQAMPFGGPVTHLAAIAETPDGPIRKINQRIFYKEGEIFPAEDPFVWYQENCDTYYALVKDMHGTFTNQGVSLAFFESEDGLNWHPAEKPLGSKLEVEWEDGTKEELAKLERAQILFEDGKPVMLYCASGKIGRFPSESFNIHIPLKMENNVK